MKTLDAGMTQVDQELAGGQVKRIFQHKLMAGLMLPALGRVIQKAANSQMTSTMAATACALERYRLEQGAYPKQLADLVPKFIKRVPLDIMSGQPLRYQLNADGTFKLYSFGRNGVDDGGSVGLYKSGNINPEEGDWVWQYPAR
jgi:type II secretory pathway pseudopilin PulG